MSEALTAWVTSELNRLDWTHAKLATKAGISRPLVSRTLSGDVPASADFCIKIAGALDTPPETVLRLAGILPPAAPATPADDTHLQQLVELARTLPPEQRKQILDYARFIAQQRD